MLVLQAMEPHDARTEGVQGAVLHGECTHVFWDGMVWYGIVLN